VVDEHSLSDQLSIQRVLYDYAWACDSGDWDLLSSVFTADSRLDYSSTGGPAGGREEVIQWLRESLSQLPLIQHVVSNFQIEVAQDRAEGRASFFTVAQIPGLDSMLTTGGYYDLALRRQSDGWKIESLIEVNKWMSPRPPDRT
jgi:3-phenylpropionate/cinnamic acid dioxygenase small subunit